MPDDSGVNLRAGAKPERGGTALRLLPRFLSRMSSYQKEQSETLQMVRDYLRGLSPPACGALLQSVEPYLAFRGEVDRFLSKYFGGICSRKCYESRLSACCSREGIITFFADVVINALVSTTREIDELLRLLGNVNTGYKCIYLGDDGCLWRVKPVVCEMFLCSPAMNSVFGQHPRAREAWEILKQREKAFTWPDRPVLFDDLEALFIDAGYCSPLMYMHNSPGLLGVKRSGNKSQKYQKKCLRRPEHRGKRCV